MAKETTTSPMVPTAPVVTVPSATTDDEDHNDGLRNQKQTTTTWLLQATKLEAMNDSVRNDLPLLVVSCGK